MTGDPTFVDLFAGAGGLALGFVRAGFVPVMGYDNWPPAVQTYRANFGDHVGERSITADMDVPPVSLIVGGPPCQGFSSAGLRRADDARNTLIGAFARLVARLKPPAFVFENVEGFLTAVDGAFVFELLDPLIEMGYRIQLRKVNAANYGVPQHRKRVFAIGGLGWDPSFPNPSHAAFGAPGAHLANGRLVATTPTLEEALEDLPPACASDDPPLSDHNYSPLSGHDLDRAKMLKPGESMRDLPEELWHTSYRRRAFRRVMDGTPTEKRGGAPAGLRRLRRDEPSKAITGGSLRDFLHPTANRPLTIRECATLQTFPTDFQFCGTSSEKAQLIGNAVPPLLAERIADSLRADLAGSRQTKPGGALLGFVPTLSSGMSPALRRVTERVMERFGSDVTREHVGLLWH